MEAIAIGDILKLPKDLGLTINGLQKNNNVKTQNYRVVDIYTSYFKFIHESGKMIINLDDKDEKFAYERILLEKQNGQQFDCYLSSIVEKLQFLNAIKN